MLLFMWSSPRALSTAFLRMMLERGDFYVVHEPLSNIIVQGYAMVGQNRVTTSAELVEALLDQARQNPVFVKEVTGYRHDVVNDERLLRLATHTFIIRRLDAVIASHYVMNPSLTSAEVGYENQFEIFRLVHEYTGTCPVVVDADALLNDPPGVVRAYCEKVGIPFLPAALSWRPGDRQEWSRTREWHRDTAQSAGFYRQRRNHQVDVHNDPTLRAYYHHHLPYYQLLHAKRLIVPPEA